QALGLKKRVADRRGQDDARPAIALLGADEKAGARPIRWIEPLAGTATHLAGIGAAHDERVADDGFPPLGRIRRQGRGKRRRAERAAARALVAAKDVARPGQRECAVGPAALAGEILPELNTAVAGALRREAYAAAKRGNAKKGQGTTHNHCQRAS